MSNIIVPIHYNSISASADLYSERFLKRREIFIYSEINSDVAQRVTAQLQFLEEQCPDLDVYILINSPGGSLADGLCIIDAIRRCQCPVSIIATGMCYSMAAVILSAGTKNKRFATANAEVMLHQPLGGTGMAQATEIDIVAKHILKARKNIYSILAKTTGKTIEAIESAAERDYYMSSKEALEFGLVDHIGFPDFDHDVWEEA